MTPFAQGGSKSLQQVAVEIDAFNAINRELAEEAGVHHIDVTPISRLAANGLSLVALDGLHLSGKMYTEWARLSLPAALSALGAAK